MMHIQMLNLIARYALALHPLDKSSDRVYSSSDIILRIRESQKKRRRIGKISLFVGNNRRYPKSQIFEQFQRRILVHLFTMEGQRADGDIGVGKEWFILRAIEKAMSVYIWRGRLPQ